MTVFSVVMPLHNKRPHVERAVRSALAQSHAPLEVVVVDDESTDGSAEIVRAIDDPRVRIVYRSPPGPGPGPARNLGIREAKGEWIAFLDADDFWTPEHLMTLSSAIAACDEEVGCAFSRAQIVRGDEMKPYPVSQAHLTAGKALDIDTILRAWLEARYCPLWTGAVAIRRDVLIDADLFPEQRAQRGEDKDMWLRTIARCKSVYSPLHTAHYHTDTTNSVSAGTAHTQLPIITETIAGMLADMPGSTRKLLRQLSNAEVTRYAKYAAGARSPVGSAFLSRLYQPEGLVPLATILGLNAVATVLRIAGPARGTADRTA